MCWQSISISVLDWLKFELKTVRIIQRSLIGSTTLDCQSSGMLPSFTIPLHKSNIPCDLYHFCYQPWQSWGFTSFHLLQYCSHFGHPDAICWSMHTKDLNVNYSTRLTLSSCAIDHSGTVLTVDTLLLSNGDPLLLLQCNITPAKWHLACITFNNSQSCSDTWQVLP